MSKETSDRVEEAIYKAITELDGHEDGDMLMDWAVVCFVENPEEDKLSGYPILVRDDNMPLHRLKGLLIHALSKLDHCTEE